MDGQARQDSGLVNSAKAAPPAFNPATKIVQPPAETIDVVPMKQDAKKAPSKAEVPQAK